MMKRDFVWVCVGALLLSAGCAEDSVGYDDRGWSDNNNSVEGKRSENAVPEGMDEAPVDGVNTPKEPGAGTLTASEWNDRVHWKDWQALLLSSESNMGYYMDVWQIRAFDRYPVRLHQGGAPVIDAPVMLYNGDGRVLWEARSDNEGQAELYSDLFVEDSPSSGTLRVVATLGDEMAEQEIEEGAEIDPAQPLALELGSEQEIPNVLDLMFVVDTTGSMDDELAYLQAELKDVVERAVEIDEQVETRLSVNFYRDTTDAYLLREFPFTTNIDEAIEQLGAQSAGGGGDVPEAVDQALEAALEHEWSEGARARLLFLILDAPPHFREEDITRMHESIRRAATLGVRIIPVVASGSDRKTEALMRSTAIATGATYVFLTDDSGVGNDHLEPEAGATKVEPFNDLLVRLIRAAIRVEGRQPASE